MRRLLFAAVALLAATLASQFPAGSWQIPKAISTCPSAGSDAWSPTYFFDTYVTVSAAPSLTSQVAVAGINKIVPEIGVLGHQIGKFYFEFTTITVPGSDLAYGLATCTHDNQTSLGFSPLPHVADSIGYQFFSTSRLWTYNDAAGSLVNLPLPSNGDVIGIAVDLTNGAIWIRNVTVAPATWYGSNTSAADPATNSNGFTFTPFAFPMFLAWASNDNGVTTEGATMCPQALLLCRVCSIRVPSLAVSYGDVAHLVV